jgi:hypothetical protein
MEQVPPLGALTVDACSRLGKSFMALLTDVASLIIGYGNVTSTCKHVIVGTLCKKKVLGNAQSFVQ